MNSPNGSPPLLFSSIRSPLLPSPLPSRLPPTRLTDEHSWFPRMRNTLSGCRSFRANRCRITSHENCPRSATVMMKKHQRVKVRRQLHEWYTRRGRQPSTPHGRQRQPTPDDGVGQRSSSLCPRGPCRARERGASCITRAVNCAATIRYTLQEVCT